MVISVWLVATGDDPGSQKLVLSRNGSIFAVKQQTSLKSEQSKCLFVLCFNDEYSALRLKWQNLDLL